MHPDIERAINVVTNAESDLRAVMAEVRKTCLHEKVIHSNWRASDHGSPFKARRLCLNCGIEEEARHSGWGDSDSDFKHLKTKGFHKVVDSWDLYRARFPETELTAP